MINGENKSSYQPFLHWIDKQRLEEDKKRKEK
jgi:hypothetical protein